MRKGGRRSLTKAKGCWGNHGPLTVAYNSFQKRKITFLKLKFKANSSFLLGHLLLQLLKEMILTLIIL